MGGGGDLLVLIKGSARYKLGMLSEKKEKKRGHEAEKKKRGGERERERAIEFERRSRVIGF